MDHLKNILDGFANAFMLGVEQRPYVRSRQGFKQDAAKLRNDAKRVGHGMKKVVGRHGKQVAESTS